MSIRPTIFYTANGSLSHTISLCDHALKFFTLMGQKVNLLHLFVGQLAWSMPATFRGHIIHIFFLSPKEKVIRVYTGWIVAMVKHVLAFWNRTIGQFPCESVSRRTLTALKRKLTVASTTGLSGPEPARFSLIDPRPKVFNGSHSIFSSTWFTAFRSTTKNPFCAIQTTSHTCNFTTLSNSLFEVAR